MVAKTQKFAVIELNINFAIFYHQAPQNLKLSL